MLVKGAFSINWCWGNWLTIQKTMFLGLTHLTLKKPQGLKGFMFLKAKVDIYMIFGVGEGINIHKR